MKKFGQSDLEIGDYVAEVFKAEDSILAKVRENSVRAGLPEINVSPLDGLLLETLAAASKAKSAIEIGTLGGYSGIRLLRGMGEGAFLDTFEISAEHGKVAAESFALAGFSKQVQIHLGPALPNLKKLAAEVPHKKFGLIFIDADKTGYPDYWHWAAENIVVGGIILADNTFAGGEIHRKREGSHRSEVSISAVRDFNRLAAEDPRFRSTIIPTGEGLTFATRIR